MAVATLIKESNCEKFTSVVALSIAKTGCYSASRPSRAFSEWENDGWKIDVEYFPIVGRLLVAPHIPYLYKIQPSNGPYTSNFRGKQQYLCNSNKAIFDYLIDKIIECQYSLKEKEDLKNFIEKIKGLPCSEPERKKHVLCPKCEINYMLEGEEMCDVCYRNSRGI